MTRRRSIPWVDVAAMARSTPGRWRLHPKLTAVSLDLVRHARRRVRALRPTEDGRFEILPRNKTPDYMGRIVLDAYVRFTPNEREAEHG